MPETRNLIDEIKQVIDITSRVDERMKIIAESQVQLNQRLNHFIDEHNALSSKVHVMETRFGSKNPDMLAIEEKHNRVLAKIEILESLGSPRQQKFVENTEDALNDIKSRIKELETHKQGISEKVKQIMGYVWQGLFIIIVCYLLYRLGLNPPPIP